jgi:cytochrome P450
MRPVAASPLPWGVGMQPRNQFQSPVAGPEATNPYPIWERIRSSEKVAELPVPGDRRSFWVTTWAGAEQVLRDAPRFSSSINYETVGPMMGKTILAMDGEEHRRYRDLVAKAFRPSSLARWGEELIAPTVDSLLDRIVPKGRAELVSELTHAYPVQIIAAILGVPVEDYDQFQRWAEGVNHGPTDPSKSVPASRAMTAYLEPIVADRRAHPRGDLISELVHAEVEGHRLDDDHLYGFLRLLLPAGAETTYRALGNLLAALLTHPEAMERVRKDRELVPAAVEETLRWETSVTMVNRLATEDAEVEGVRIPAEASVLVALGSANHDPARYDRPDEWDLDRPPRPHLAFGTGRHQCLGMHLARLELRIALNAVLDRLPGLRLDPDYPPPEPVGFAFRSPSELHVLFDRA